MARKRASPRSGVQLRKGTTKQGKVITAADLQPAVLEGVSDATLAACMPLFWHDRELSWPKPVTGASCFVLRFVEQLVVVTAGHVFRIYEADCRNNQKLICQLRLLPFDLSNAGIDIDDDLDILTLPLTER